MLISIFIIICTTVSIVTYFSTLAVISVIICIKLSHSWLFLSVCYYIVKLLECFPTIIIIIFTVIVTVTVFKVASNTVFDMIDMDILITVDYLMLYFYFYFTFNPALVWFHL